MVRASAAELVQLHAGVTFRAEVTEVDLDLEVLVDLRVLLGRIWVHCVLGELVYIILDEARVQSKSTYKFIFHGTLVHKSKIYVTT